MRQVGYLQELLCLYVLPHLKRNLHYQYHHDVTCYDFKPSLQWSTYNSLSPRLARQDSAYLCDRWSYRLRRFVIALCSGDSNTAIFCACFHFFQISRSAATAPQGSSAPGANSPNTELLVQSSFATVCIMANGWWIFRCHCHHKARSLVCSLIRKVPSNRYGSPACNDG